MLDTREAKTRIQEQHVRAKSALDACKATAAASWGKLSRDTMVKVRFSETVKICIIRRLKFREKVDALPRTRPHLGHHPFVFHLATVIRSDISFHAR
jgi:hypothetical protein